MDKKEVMLATLMGKSFTLLNGIIVDIYLLFDKDPMPFFLIKRRDFKGFHQIRADELVAIVAQTNPEIL